MELKGKESVLWLKILYGTDKKRMITPKSKSIYLNKINGYYTKLHPDW